MNIVYKSTRKKDHLFVLYAHSIMQPGDISKSKIGPHDKRTNEQFPEHIVEEPSDSLAAPASLETTSA